MQYSVENLVKLARRDNNTIRPYLYVNPIQAKHIPANPKDTMGMCKKIAEIVNAAYPNDGLMVIGFAETATGIASEICRFLNNVIYYQNTTREYKEKEDYLFFTESHSHATDQMLRTYGLGEAIDFIDRIIFIDDEVTTGNTICKLIDVIKGKFGVDRLKYSIVSILNSMDEERIQDLKNREIDCLFLAKLPFEYRKESILDIEYEPRRDIKVYETNKVGHMFTTFETNLNARSVVRFELYCLEIKRFVSMMEDKINSRSFESVLVLGTEEFMFPAIYMAEKLIEDGFTKDIKVHATTRSPIIASGVENYPLNQRYQIRSLYDENRTTYIYNLEKYDLVIVVTDSERGDKGAEDLLYALHSVGNNEILLIQWRYNLRNGK